MVRRKEVWTARSRGGEEYGQVDPRVALQATCAYTLSLQFTPHCLHLLCKYISHVAMRDIDGFKDFNRLHELAVQISVGHFGSYPVTFFSPWSQSHSCLLAWRLATSVSSVPRYTARPPHAIARVCGYCARSHLIYLVILPKRALFLLSSWQHSSSSLLLKAYPHPSPPPHPPFPASSFLSPFGPPLSLPGSICFLRWRRGAGRPWLEK